MTRFLIVLIGLWLAPLAPAATLYVSTNNSPSSTPPYDTWAKAATNIQNAVYAATNDVVLVTNGLYTCASSLSGTIRAMVVVTNNVRIRSVNGRDFTIVDGGNTGEFTNRCFYISNANAVVSGFTITNGRAYAASPNNGGGGVFIDGFGTVTNCVIAGNTASNYGGGVYNSAGLVQGCVISNNLVSGRYPCSGGGLYLVSGTAIWCTITMNAATSSHASTSTGGGVTILSGGTLTNCTVCNNALRAGVDFSYGLGCGGGISMQAGRISNCNIFSNNNLLMESGGGIYIYGTSIVENCTISNNMTQSQGGGIYTKGGGGGTIRNCLIRNNSAYLGGGIDLDTGAGCTQKVENCTIVSNRVSGSGGGVCIFKPGNVQIVNSIIYSNTSVAVGYNNWQTNGWENGAFSNCCVIPTNSAYGVLPGTGNITNYPKFMDPMANYRLTNGSPCINAGTNQDWMTGARDLDGHNRLDGFSGLVDIGAYEYLPKGTIVSIR